MIRIKLSRTTGHKVTKRLKNRARIRKKVAGTVERPRFAVFKSARHIYAQLIDDVAARTLVSVSSLSEDFKGVKKVDAAKKLGGALAKMAIDKNIKNVVFDRGGYVYHGRIKAVADGAREAGLNF